MRFRKRAKREAERKAGSSPCGTTFPGCESRPMSVGNCVHAFSPLPQLEVVHFSSFNSAGAYERDILSLWESRALRPGEGFAI